MRVCGVELKGGEAIICLLAYDRGAYQVSDCRQRLFKVSQSTATESIREFQFAFKKLMQDYKIDEVVILERAQKGKFAGSATSFKLEAAIQLIDIPVTVLMHAEQKAQIKRKPMLVDFDGLELKKFQKPAFEVAYAFQNQRLYGALNAD
jgi:hypothetical protein